MLLGKKKKNLTHIILLKKKGLEASTTYNFNNLKEELK